MAGDNDSDSDPNYSDPDDDNDEIPDSWEGLHGLDPLLDDASANPDGDSFSNLEEYVSDTSPTNGAGFPKLELNLPPTNDLLEISFATSPARNYRVYFSGDLGEDSWLPLSSELQGTGASILIQDPAATNETNRFYRLRITLP